MRLFRGAHPAVVQASSGPGYFRGTAITAHQSFPLILQTREAIRRHCTPLSFGSTLEFAELDVACAEQNVACEQGFFYGLWYSAVLDAGPPYQSTVPTPEPGVLALLLSGLIALAVWWNWSQVAGNRGRKVAR